MGNTQSLDQILEDQYNIDAEVVSNNDKSVVPTITTPLDIKLNKMYIVYHRLNGKSKTFVLTVKIIDENIFIYTTDTSTNKTILSHVSKINVQDDRSAEYYLKYVQISRDFTLISLPENNKVNVYNLTKLLINNIMEYVNSVGIILKQDEHGNLRSGVEIVGNDNKNTVGAIEFKYIDCEDVQPIKCVLCKDLFIVVCSKLNRYRKVVAVDYKNKLSHKIINVDLDMDNSSLRFSTNGNHVAIYDGDKKQLFVADMSKEDPKLEKLPLVINTRTLLDTICISDDGRFFFYVDYEDMMFRIYDIYFKKIYVLRSGLKLNTTHIEEIKFHMMNYSRYTDIILTENTCDHLYVLVGWSKKLSSAFYWIIRCSKETYHIYDPSYVNMKIDGKIEYIYNNGYIFIYKTSSGLTVYDLNKIIPIRFAGILASDINNRIKENYDLNYDNNSYYDNIILIGADNDSTGTTYPVNNYMQFLMSLKKPYSEGIIQNKFNLDITANIFIYGTKKSFSIYQDLLTGKTTQSEIIDNIFMITGDVGRNNTMNSLLDHFYGYTRIIGLKDVDDNISNKSSHHSLLSMYIGYLLIVLILKYYSNLIKTSDNIDMSMLDTFCKNFPIFKNFMDRSIDLIIGEKIENQNN